MATFLFPDQSSRTTVGNEMVGVTFADGILISENFHRFQQQHEAFMSMN